MAPTTIEAIFKANGSKFPFKIVRQDWPSSLGYIVALARTRKGHWIGEDEDGHHWVSFSHEAEWLPYTEPKPPVRYEAFDWGDGALIFLKVGSKRHALISRRRGCTRVPALDKIVEEE